MIDYFIQFSTTFKAVLPIKVEPVENLSEGRWLRAAVAQTGMSISEFARRAGVSRDAMQKWFNQPVLQIRPDLLIVVLRALRLPDERLKYFIEEFAQIQEHASEGESRESLQNDLTRKIMNSLRWQAHRDAKDEHNVDPYSEEPAGRAPVFDVALAAGPLGEPIEAQQPVEWMDVPLVQGQAFVVRLRGNSMKPDYLEGDLILFRSLQFGAEGPKPGEDYYVQTPDGATFKRFVEFDDEREVFVFRGLNKKMCPKPMELHRDMVSRLAVAVVKLLKLRKTA